VDFGVDVHSFPEPPTDRIWFGPRAFDLDEKMRVYALHGDTVYVIDSAKGVVHRIAAVVQPSGDLTVLGDTLFVYGGGVLAAFSTPDMRKVWSEDIASHVETMGIRNLSFFEGEFLFVRRKAGLLSQRGLAHIYDLRNRKLSPPMEHEGDFCLLRKKWPDCDLRFCQELFGDTRQLHFAAQSRKYLLLRYICTPRKHPGTCPKRELRVFALDTERSLIAPLGERFTQATEGMTLLVTRVFACVDDSTFVYQRRNLDAAKRTATGLSYVALRLHGDGWPGRDEAD
jgi:hypothetical protein